MKRGQFARLKAEGERVEKYGEHVKCATCGSNIAVRTLTKHQRDRLRVGKVIYCSKECGKTAISENGKRTMANQELKERLKRMSTERLVRNNYYRDAASKEKAMKTKLANGWKPIWVENPDLRGGNGKYSNAQRLLWERLNVVSRGWEMEQAVSLISRQQGYPSNYKLDIGNTYYKIGIECDGSSHSSAKARAKDKKKEEKLSELGWKVLRFSNSEILSNVDSIVTQIMSIVSM